MKNIINFVAVVIFFTVLSFLIRNGESVGTPYIKIAGVTLKIELAETPEAKQQGLSGRNGLAENTGMLFLFEEPGAYGFWMKDMNFAIDIIWLGEDGEVIYIKKDARPESFPETFGPERDAKYVLEVVSGFSDKNNLKVGDQTEFTF